MHRSQLRAARALVSWSQERLAEASGVSVPTIKRLEPGDGELPTRVETMLKLRRALESAGVEFTNGGEPGVKLRRSADAASREHVEHEVKVQANVDAERRNARVRKGVT